MSSGEDCGSGTAGRNPVGVFEETCRQCGAGVEVRVYEGRIPRIGAVHYINMACEECGYKSSEIKEGRDVESAGRELCCA